MNKKGLVFLGSGFELVGMILAAIYIGKSLDSYFEVKGVYVGVCILVFMALWTFHFVILLKRYMDDPENQYKDESEGQNGKKH